MKTLNNKILVITISIFFMLSMTASMVLVPSAHASNIIPVYAYISVAPNPTGLNQGVEIIMWVQVIFGTNAELTNTYRFSNPPATPSWTLVITAPDGTNTTETLGVVSSPTSTYDYYFAPSAVGTYTLTFYFPSTQVTAENDPTSPIIGDTYTAASASTTLTVQQAAISAIPQTPLPTSYWMRPIYGENSAWYTLGSNWLGFGSPGYRSIGGGPNLGANGAMFGPSTNVGPLTSHVMWTTPMTSGGIVGQTATTIPGNSYAEGSAYDQKFTNPIIVDGMLIYTQDISQTLPASGPTIAVNLQTGQQIWKSSTIPQISFAYVYDAEDPNQHGVWPPMLVAASGSTWRVFDAFTGTPLFNVTNIPGQGFFGPAANTATVLGPNGEYLMLLLTNYGTRSNPNWYMQEWNSSRLWDNLYSGPSTTPTIPPPITNGSDPSLYDYNVSLPWLNTAALNGAPISSITALGAIQGDMLLAYAGNFPSAGQNLFFGVQSSAPWETFGIGINATSGTLGTELWHNVLQAPPNNITITWGCLDPVNNVFVLEYRETMQYIGFSLNTGLQIWGPTAPQAALDYYGCQASGSLATTTAYGNIYSAAYAGLVYAYSTKTGNIIWTYGNGGEGNSTDSGVETPFGNYPTFVVAVGNGVVYTVTSEHTEETPIFKGGSATALNATTGAEIWTLSDYTGEFFTGSYAIADGYSTFFNGYDNQIYSVGRGPSATTVTAPNTGVTTSTPVVITGTVMDVSAGTQQSQQKADFPYGVPVASDAIMRQWMGYVYQQQPLPTNFTGVPVTIAVTDSNGNCYDIGTATTNYNGFYSLTWTPTIPGNFTVTATFAGTAGYWPSTASTAFYASTPSSTTTTTTSAPSNYATTTDFILGIVAVIVAIIIIGALTILTLRKRP